MEQRLLLLAPALLLDPGVLGTPLLPLYDPTASPHAQPFPPPRPVTCRAVTPVVTWGQGAASPGCHHLFCGDRRRWISLKTPPKGEISPALGQPKAPQLCPHCPLCPTDRHHGTPMLLDGVRCVGAELEYDSEQSDWHGFD